MTLRRWQSECIEGALTHYQRAKHFFCQATPGAGKTRMSAELALQLIDQKKIDLVICFGPSTQVVEGFRSTFEAVLERPFNGQLGSIGAAVTYQSLLHQKSSFWSLFEQFRVLAIFDEIHHCSSGEADKAANAWGQKIIRQIQDVAAYTMALSGTPWRSDDNSIALARYSSPDGHLIIDYSYSLTDAIQEHVCREPNITLLDNSDIQVEKHGSLEYHCNSVAKLLKDSEVSYLDVITNKEFNIQLLKQARGQLNLVRQSVPDAGGLIVASSIKHAYQVSTYLQTLDEGCTIVTTNTDNASTKIDQFRNDSSRWIVSVGMISEGTDIPRLQVCCYLSHFRTELYFRQVLGRVLRMRQKNDSQAWMFILAEPELYMYAKRLMDDLPEELGTFQLKGLKPKSIEVGTETLSSTPSSLENSSSKSPLDIKPNFLERASAEKDEFRRLIVSGSFHKQLLTYF